MDVLTTRLPVKRNALDAAQYTPILEQRSAKVGAGLVGLLNAAFRSAISSRADDPSHSQFGKYPRSAGATRIKTDHRP